MSLGCSVNSRICQVLKIGSTHFEMILFVASTPLYCRYRTQIRSLYEKTIMQAYNMKAR